MSAMKNVDDVSVVVHEHYYEVSPSPGRGAAIAIGRAICKSGLGKGGVTIVNLFSKINDFALKEAEAEDPENIRAIVSAAESADCVVLASGTGKQKNKTFQLRLEQVLTALRPYESKLHCLCDKNGGSRHLHPPSPRVRE